jgi:plastocyanin
VSDTGGFAPATVDILVGGKVNFAYPSGTGRFNVVWDRGSLEPASCQQTEGPVWGDGTTLPWWLQAAPWAGNCTFTKPGTYTYHSGVDPDKNKGTVVVHADATPTATPTVTATPTSTPNTARVEAHDTATPARNWFQDATGDASDNSVTIKAGGTVTFAFPAGTSSHNVTFPNAPKPALCPQTKMANTVPFLDPDNAPPMPGFAQGVGWAGTCTFDTPGTYTFVCSSHPTYVTGTVIVGGGGAP